MISTRTALLASALGISFALSAGAATNATAGTTPPRTKRIVGTVLQINDSERTLVVREDGTNSTYTVHIPAGDPVPLSKSGNPGFQPTAIPFEIAQRGNRVNVRVELTGQVGQQESARAF